MSTKELRVNHRIRVTPVRLIGPQGDQLGIVPTSEALERARESGLDLVEVSPNSRPPVCRILDFGKFKYELAKKDKMAKKRQHSFQLKEMRYRPKIDEHDFRFKTRHVQEFLETGSKVRVYVMFRGRELAHMEFGEKVLKRVAEELKDLAVIEAPIKQEGRNMTMVLSPNAELLKRLKTQKPAKPKDDRTEITDETLDLDEVEDEAVDQEVADEEN